MQSRQSVYVRVIGIPEKMLVTIPVQGSNLYSKEVVIQTSEGQYVGFVNSFAFESDIKAISGKVLREVDSEDRQLLTAVEKKSALQREEIRLIASELGLAMEITHVQFSLDERSATIFFTASDRVDFRELLKRIKLQYRFKCTLRQISQIERDACFHLDPRII